MPTAPAPAPAPVPLVDAAALLAEAAAIDHDAAALSVMLAHAWPRAIGRVLTLAARAGALDRSVAALNGELARAGLDHRVSVVKLDPPLAVGNALWCAVWAAEEARDVSRA